MLTGGLFFRNPSRLQYLIVADRRTDRGMEKQTSFDSKYRAYA